MMRSRGSGGDKPPDSYTNLCSHVPLGVYGTSLTTIISKACTPGNCIRISCQDNLKPADNN